MKSTKMPFMDFYELEQKKIALILLKKVLTRHVNWAGEFHKTLEELSKKLHEFGKINPYLGRAKLH